MCHVFLGSPSELESKEHRGCLPPARRFSPPLAAVLLYEVLTTSAGGSWVPKALHSHTQDSTALPSWLSSATAATVLRWPFVNRSPCKVLEGGFLPACAATVIQ